MPRHNRPSDRLTTDIQDQPEHQTYCQAGGDERGRWEGRRGEKNGVEQQSTEEKGKRKGRKMKKRAGNWQGGVKRREHQGNAQSWNIVVSFSPHAYEAVVKWHTGQLTTAHLLFLKPISHCSSTLIGLTCSNRLLKMACLYQWVHVRCMSTKSKYQLVVFAY